MKGKDNRITCFDGDQTLEQGCRCRIGYWCHGSNDANRFSNLEIVLVIIFVDNTDRFIALDAVVDVFGRKDVLGHLVFDDSAASFLNGCLSQLSIL